MGKGRDKRKKHEDPTKALKRQEKQQSKLKKHEEKVDGKEDTTVNTVALNGEEDVNVTVQKLKKKEEKRRVVTETVMPHPPTPRVNATFLPHPVKENEFILFGGEYWDGQATLPYNDLFIYHAIKNQWRSIQAPLTPCPRSSCQTVNYKQYLIFFGGEYVSQTQSQFLHFKDTWRFDANNYTWDEMKAKGSSPSSRSGHRMVLWKRKAVLFGGFFDNALQANYFNDLWVLSDLEGNGSWEQSLFPSLAELPAKRSGHCMGVYQDTLFVYGGFSAESASRLHKAEATVHHDLWSLDLSSNVNVWNKLKLQGIPPPIRSGMSYTFKDKKLYMFGGVVDIDAPGGRTLSSFFRDLFVFHMDSGKFYPVVLQGASKKGKKKDGKGEEQEGPSKTNDLAAQLAAIGAESESDETEEEECVPTTSETIKKFTNADASSNAADENVNASLKISSIKGNDGAMYPCNRMNSMLCISGHMLYLYGGQYEVGKKEVSVSDCFALNLNRLDTFIPLFVQDLTQLQWNGQEDEDGETQGSWEDGSTIVDSEELGRLEALQNFDDDDDDDDSFEEGEQNDESEEDEDDDNDEEGDQQKKPVKFSELMASEKPVVKSILKNKEGGQEPVTKVQDDDDEIPNVIPKDMEQEEWNLQDKQTRVQGKTGRKVHKAQLQAQLSSTACVPSPLTSETLKEFFARTQAFWLNSAREVVVPDEECSKSTAVAEGKQNKPSSSVEKKIKTMAFQFCHVRYDEALTLLEQIHLVEDEEAQEELWIQEQLAKKKAEHLAMKKPSKKKKGMEATAEEEEN